MASKLPAGTLTLKQFIKRKEVLKLYKDILFSIQKLDCDSDKVYFSKWVREEFRKYKHEQNEDVINYHIRRGKNELKQLQAGVGINQLSDS